MKSEKDVRSAPAVYSAEVIRCKNCRRLKDDWCDQKRDSPDPDMWRCCEFYIPATNGDRVRAMNDEDLSYVIAHSDYWGTPPWCHMHDKKICPYLDDDMVPCEKCVEKWLGREVDE